MSVDEPDERIEICARGLVDGENAGAASFGVALCIERFGNVMGASCTTYQNRKD